MALFPTAGRSAGARAGITRRRLPVMLGMVAALRSANGVAAQGRPASAPRPGTANTETIAEIAQVALPDQPLEVHIARVVLPIGVALPAATPSGVRLLAVTAGALTIELAETAPSALLAPAAPTGQRLVLPAGRAIALDAGAVVGVGNVGTRPVVLLDAAVFAEGERPPARAFTTNAGVGFQVLAGGAAGAPPAGPCTVSLSRTEVRSGATIALAGMSLAYTESGTGWALATTGDVRYARAAGQAPGSSAGPWRGVDGSREAPLTAGSALLLGPDGAARIGNAGQRAVRLLLVTVRPDDPGTGSPGDRSQPQPLATPAPNTG